MNNEPTFGILTDQYDVSFPEYYNMTKTFGHFEDDGRKYVVTDRNTPRQWFSIMVNKNFGSIMTNNGMGFMGYKSFFLQLTKWHSETDYMARELNGEKRIIIEDETGKKYDLFAECENMTFTVMPGSCIYKGSMAGIEFEILCFVPVCDPVECIKVKLNSIKNRKLKIYMRQDWGLHDRVRSNAPVKEPITDFEVSEDENSLVFTTDKIYMLDKLCGFTFQKGMKATLSKYTDRVELYDKNYTYTRVTTEKEICTDDNGNCVEYIFSGACEDDASAIIEKYLTDGVFEKEYELVNAKWDEIIERNYCELPDKNMQYFLNVWLKNQVNVTSLYNRFGEMGYRDILQDCWGATYVDLKVTRDHVLAAANVMYEDGRCPRQFDLYSDHLDTRDFADSPIWMPIALNYYLKETGDFKILDEVCTYFGSDKTDTLTDHILTALDYLYNSRGKNGLILMRGGDWLDGLGGINKLGEATAVWLTIAAFHAQNLMADIFEQIGDIKNAELMKVRSAEYKKIVNEVGWNGKWYSYAIINDTEVIGGPDCIEGKIYINPQSWAIFTGIADEEKTKKLMRAVNLYLTTPYGPQLLAPPYVHTGHNYGRLQKQRPGTFANGAIYLHGASFKVFADAARGDCEEAYDTFMRILPNHRDNPDSRRTNEPYAVGNVYYGNDHQCSGQNLYSWFSATPAWLIHGGFEELLGVKPEFDGLSIKPLRLEDWDGYTLSRTYRSTVYNITFKRSDKNLITLDGKAIEGNTVKSENPVAEVLVEYI